MPIMPRKPNIAYNAYFCLKCLILPIFCHKCLHFAFDAYHFPMMAYDGWVFTAKYMLVYKKIMN